MNGGCFGRLSGLTLAILMVVMVAQGWAADDASVKGTVSDPLGARVSGAAVKLLVDGKVVKDASSDAAGNFAFDALASGRYQIEVSAAGFRTRTTDPMFVGGGARVAVDVALPIGPLEESVSVTSAATDVLPSQIGAPVTVLDSKTLEILGKTDVLEALRLVPGGFAGRNRGEGRHRLDFHPRWQLQLQQGAHRRDSGQRYRRRHRSLAVLDGRRRAHRGAPRSQQRHRRDRCAGRRDQRDVAPRPNPCARGALLAGRRQFQHES